jgi:hypothetical protein
VIQPLIEITDAPPVNKPDGFEHIHPLDSGIKPKGYWTYDRCLIAAKECAVASFSGWRKKHRNSYNQAHRMGQARNISDVLEWPKPQEPAKFYSKYENVLKLVLDANPKGFRDWQKNHGKTYRCAVRNGFSERIRKDMKWQRELKPRGYWLIYDNVLNAAKNSGATDIGDFCKKESKAYSGAKKARFIDRLVVDMEWVRQCAKNGHWASYDKALAAVKACGATGLGKIKKLHPKVYAGIHTYGHVQRLVTDMKWSPKWVSEVGYWDDEERCIKACEECGATGTKDLQVKNANAYKGANKYGHMQAIIKHFNFRTINSPGHWDDYKKVLKAAKASGASYIQEWRDLDHASYMGARTRGWVERVRLDMKWPRKPATAHKKSDTLYVWNTLENKSLYKIGITSESRGLRRINEVAHSSPYTLGQVVFFCKVPEAYMLEAHILSLGTPLDTNEPFSGHTEFRYMDNEDIAQMQHILAPYDE